MKLAGVVVLGFVLRWKKMNLEDINNHLKNLYKNLISKEKLYK